MELAEEKRHLRQEGIAARRGMTAEQRQQASEAICRAIHESPLYRRATRILLYWAVGGEVDLTPLVQLAEAEGKVLCWPVCLPEHRMEALHPRSRSSWQTGAYGIPAPTAEGSDRIPPQALDLVLAPCSRFDEAGGRIGMGGGYYDRYLPQCRCPVVAVAFEGQKAERVVQEPWDRPMDYVVTQGGWYPAPPCEKTKTRPQTGREEGSNGMEQMTKQRCEDFLAALATKAPVPGGGGASALVGAIGVALGNMVGSLTVGKKKYAAVEEQILRLNAEAETLRLRLEALVTADATAFAPLSDAYRLPTGTEEERAHKAQVMEAALDGACAVPMEIMEACCQGLALVEQYAAMGSVMALSDAGVAAVCCKAALQGASLNVRINTKAMADRQKAEGLNATMEGLLAQGCAQADRIYETVTARL
jgi:5,10-methenyltetrahydrofolate synthetase